ncbi:hypothetical protein SAMN05216464_110165 [Mucilaginibacter pineti]|uniref:Uncharacterized protein n=1 Tax=Mucilaginibacter pineti TaxID=1391627 RepID=A0A1G7GJ54_9SPHI|nr:hypothetical protein [Mucilaginibacter pineti]SDE88029.1 hypothetical protein SAMN05216464_110165 [Mucilaginibacter pineti]
MFKSITWSNYYTTVFILLALWYVIIILVYFRKEFFNLLNGKYNIPTRRKKQQTPEEEIPEDQEHTFEELERIVADIRHSIFEEAGNNISKDELLTQLKQRLVNYGGLRQPAFRVAINNFIIQYAESICGVAFSEDELNEAWETLPR